MGEGRAMRLATRDFYAMGPNGDTNSIRTFGARGREIEAQSSEQVWHATIMFWAPQKEDPEGRPTGRTEHLSMDKIIVQ